MIPRYSDNRHSDREFSRERTIRLMIIDDR